VTATESARAAALVAAQAASDKHGTDVVIIDVSDRLPLTDCFAVVTAANERQVGAIIDEVTEQLAHRGVKALRREGERDGRWVLLDFGDVVVHVQHAEERVFYALERLWGDCPTIPFVDDALPVAGSVTEPVAETVPTVTRA
jgi:ribosome-associated protein